MEARRFPEPEVVGSIPTAGAFFCGMGKHVDTEGFEPSTSRMRNGRSSTELSAHIGYYVRVAQWKSA